MLELYPIDNKRQRYRFETRNHPDGEPAGWKLIEMDNDGTERVFQFNEHGILTAYDAPEIIKHFDAQGEITEWVEWETTVSDGIGEETVKIVYDKHGHVIDERWV